MISEKYREILTELFNAGLSDMEMASAVSLSPETIPGYLSHLGLTNRKLANFPVMCNCGKEFFAKTRAKKHCDECKEISTHTYFSICHIRSSFADLRIANPTVAKKLKKEMLEKEGEEFTLLALNGV